MSNPNRNRALVGFGVLAVIVVAAIAFWPPTFRSEEASGAIGAVQKHHAPQIAQKDVILGDEKTRTKQAVLYGDYFDHAQKLHSLSAALLANESANISRDIEALQAELNSRGSAEMGAMLHQIASEAQAANQIDLAQKATALYQALDANLEAGNMTHFYSEFANVAEAESKIKDQETLQSLNQELSSAVKNLNDQELASSKLHDVEMGLKAEASQFNDIDLASATAYFSNLQAAMKTLAEAKSEALQGKFVYSAEMLAKVSNNFQEAAASNIEQANAELVANAVAMQEMQSMILAGKQSGNVAEAGAFAEVGSALELCANSLQQTASAILQNEVASVSEVASAIQESKSMSGNMVQASAVANSAQANVSAVYSILNNASELSNVLQNVDNTLNNNAMQAMLNNEAQIAARVANVSNELGSQMKP